MTQLFIALFIITALLFVIYWTYIRYMRISKGKVETWYSKGFWILFISTIVFLLLMVLGIYVM